MEKTQASKTLVVTLVTPPPTPAVKTRDDTNRPLKFQNPKLYYSNSYMECYNFCQ